MSAFLMFASQESTIIGNTSFKILYNLLKISYFYEPIARRIIDSNPIGLEIKCLNLLALTHPEMVSFHDLLLRMLNDLPKISLTWNSPGYLENMETDMTLIISDVEKAISSPL